MKILQLCKKYPYPLKDGESLAVTVLSKALSQLGCEISLLAMNTSKHYYNSTAAPEDLQHYRDIQTVPVDNRVKPLEAFFNLFSPDSYHITRYISSGFRQKLIEVLQSQSFDVIQLETPYLAPYIPVIRKYSDAAVAMRAHNVEHEIWQRIVAHTAFYPKRRYLMYLAEKLRRFELEQLQHYDLLAAITERDLCIFKELGYRNAATVVPIGIQAAQYEPDYNSYRRPISLSFIGSLDWIPNQEGLKWFLAQAWPHLARRYPDIELHIAGRNTPDWAMEMNIERVAVHGEVSSATQFINQHSIMIVPLLAGGGMRAKILEGMALGKVVVATSLGLEGIAARDGREALIADTPEQFINKIDWCYQQKQQLEQLGRQARDFVAQQYDSLEAARRLQGAYAALMVEAI